MALVKSIENPARNGATAEYWNVGELRFNNKARVIEVLMHGYKDKEYREEEINNPAFAFSCVIQGEDFDKNMTLSQVYTYIKTNSGEFADAQDDI